MSIFEPRSFFEGLLRIFLVSSEWFASPYGLVHFKQSPRVFEVFTEYLKKFKDTFSKLVSMSWLNLSSFKETFSKLKFSGCWSQYFRLREDYVD